jgi:ferredoxin like protein
VGVEEAVKGGKAMTVEDKLALDAFKTDAESHIRVVHELCRSRCRVRHCLRICPGKLYRYNEALDEIEVEFAGCLECGTCRIGCSHGAIDWRYPRGGYGVQYRCG